MIHVSYSQRFQGKIDVIYTNIYNMYVGICVCVCVCNKVERVKKRKQMGQMLKIHELEPGTVVYVCDPILQEAKISSART
jgi:hypothetical protein